MQKTLLLVINPHAGRASIRSSALDIIDVFVKENYKVTVFTTQQRGDPYDIIKRYGKGYDRIVCCGGDGTVNEGINGLMALSEKPVFGVIPVGVTNDYAYSLSIPSVAERAAQIAATGHKFAIDIGLFNDRYFAYVAAFGLLTDITWSTPQDMKNSLGTLAYMLEALKRVSAFREYHLIVEHDTGIIQGDYIVGLFSNTVSIGGLRTAYTDALLDDGEMEITLIKKPKQIEDFQDFIDILLNVESTSTLDSEFLLVIRTTRAKITCDEALSWTVDGEHGGEHSEAEITVIPRAINVIAGRDMAANSVASQPEKGDSETKLL